MTHYLEDFTELLPQSTTLAEQKSELLKQADATGLSGFLREHAISDRAVERRVDDEVGNFMTDRVAEIITQRGLIAQDLIDLLGFTHEDPDDDFIAAVKDAVQVSFVYEVAEQNFKDQERRHQSVRKNGSSREEVQKFVEEIATSCPELAGPPTLHCLDEMIAELHASAPWMSGVSAWIYKALRAQYNAGQTWLNLPPVILVGPPGCGKSTYARKLAQLASVPFRTLDAAASNASFTVVGSDPTWGKSHAGVPLQEIAKTGVANPIMIVDEIEKAGTMTSSSGQRLSLPDALLGLLEPSSSMAWECPYTRRTYNMSKISWIMTGNERDGIPVPLLDRCRVFDIGYPEQTDLAQLIREQSAGQLFDEVTECLIARVSTDVSKGRRPSLRRIGQLIDDAAAVGQNPVLH